MYADNNIICFQHCCSTSIFCKQVPTVCPLCNNNCLSKFTLEPFVVPHPLVNAKDHPCCIIVRPSTGNFLDNYTAADDLHIGVTNSLGNIVEFDKCGLVSNDYQKWKECVAISLIPESWQTFWDELLMEMSNSSKWHWNNYDEVNFNCFNFVIEFLKNLKHPDMQFVDKESLCEAFILPKIENILKYALLHTKLMDKQYYVQD